MALKSINPATCEEYARYEEMSDEEVVSAVALAHEAFGEWRKVKFGGRAEYMLKMAEVLRARAREFGEIMAREMGKPVKAAVAEAEKCAWVCEFYAQNAEKFLEREVIDADVAQSYVQFDPIGIVLAVMPWNFPFWQVIRAAAPAIMAGNTMLLKHASNVPGCAKALGELFKEAGFPEGVFTNLAIGSAKVEMVIKDERVKAATLTGSGKAGGIVASECGNEIMKVVLELGGSDPFIVLGDADLELACKTAVGARFQNNGQSCIAAKRFIVVDEVYDDFVSRFKELVSELKIGDQMDDGTDIGPLATEAILNDIVAQVDKSVEMGAELVLGGKRSGVTGWFYEPTILGEVKKGMPAYDEETFGPVAAVIRVADEAEAIEVANDTEFGLGASIWSGDVERAKELAGEVFAGAVFVNSMVKSDPRLPFGGTKKSGIGRELSHYGIKEFVNLKTVSIGSGK